MFKVRLGLIYFVSGIAAVLSGDMFNSRKILKKYKNKYQGKRCFIIGNGPSLSVRDLDKLKGEITFASNRIYKIFNETDWRPTFWAVFDESVGASDGFLENINKYSCEMKFFRQEGFWVNRFFTGPKCLLHSWWSRKYLDDPKFSLDIEKGVYTIATVTYTMFQIARYMGFTEIYLLGVDHKYQHTLRKDGSVSSDNSTESYFGKKLEVEKKVQVASWEMEVAYDYAERFSSENAFRIFNATRGGFLESFERVDFELLFKE